MRLARHYLEVNVLGMLKPASYHLVSKAVVA